MHRNDVEKTLRSVYAARAQNDAVAVGSFFAPGATFRVSGHPAFCLAAATYTGPALQPGLEKLCANFRASAFDVISMIVEEDRAAVICHADFQYTPTGELFSLGLAHFWTFIDGKAIELVEFFDTAHVAHVITQVPPRQTG